MKARGKYWQNKISHSGIYYYMDTHLACTMTLGGENNTDFFFTSSNHLKTVAGQFTSIFKLRYKQEYQNAHFQTLLLKHSCISEVFLPIILVEKKENISSLHSLLNNHYSVQPSKEIYAEL